MCDNGSYPYLLIGFVCSPFYGISLATSCAFVSCTENTPSACYQSSFQGCLKTGQRTGTDFADACILNFISFIIF